MPGQTFRFAAIRRHEVNVQVARVLAAEGDPSSVRREMRIRRLALKTCDAPRHTARARNDPDILSVRERDLIRAYGWRAQQTSAGRLRSRC